MHPPRAARPGGTAADGPSKCMSILAGSRFGRAADMRREDELGGCRTAGTTPGRGSAALREPGARCVPEELFGELLHLRTQGELVVLHAALAAHEGDGVIDVGLHSL